MQRPASPALVVASLGCRLALDEGARAEALAAHRPTTALVSESLVQAGGRAVLVVTDRREGFGQVTTVLLPDERWILDPAIWSLHFGSGVMPSGPTLSAPAAGERAEDWIQAGDDRVAVSGNTYPVRDQLVKMGGSWNQEQRAWMMPPHQAEEAQRLVDAAPKATGGWGRGRGKGRGTSGGKRGGFRGGWKRGWKGRGRRRSGDSGAAGTPARAPKAPVPEMILVGTYTVGDHVVYHGQAAVVKRVETRNSYTDGTWVPTAVAVLKLISTKPRKPRAKVPA